MLINEWKSGLLTKAKENGTRVAAEKFKECKVKLDQRSVWHTANKIHGSNLPEDTLKSHLFC